MKRVDLTGKQFFRLTVLGYAGTDKRTGNAQWYCRCSCGRQIIADGYRLRKGMTKSCGCYRAEVARTSIMQNKATRAQMYDKHCSESVRVEIMMAMRRTNHTGVVGVSFDKRSQMWVARMMYKGKLVLNSRSKDFATARQARLAAELQYLGQNQAREHALAVES